MLVGVLSLPVLLGILLFWSLIVSLLPSLVLLSMMMVVLGLLCILLFGLMAVWLRDARLESLPWEYAWVPGPVGLWRHGSISWPCIEVCDDDVGFWPYSVGLLVKLCSFLSSLHWPSTVSDLGVGGVSFIELLILCERWAGERLVLEMSVPKLRRLYRPISVSAVSAGPSIDIWRSCRFLGAMLRALGGRPGGLGRFIPCRIGANHCRLRSIGWEMFGHGLTSGPLEASSTGFLDDLLSLFGYPSGSGQSLVDGSFSQDAVLF